MNTLRSVSLSVTLALSAGCGSTQHAAVTAPVVEAPYHVTSGDLAAAVAGPQRSETDRARDRYRHPVETLTFLGVHPGQTVVELSPGAGWYTSILAPLLHDNGHLIAATGDPANPNAHGVQQFVAMLHAHPEIYRDVQVTLLDPPAHIELGPDASADVVLTFRNLHNWVNNHTAEPVMAAIFRVLKPGGILGIEDHRARPGTDVSVTAHNGYVSEAAVIAMAQQAGFVLDGQSEVNANPLDTTDHPDGVWSLPPTLRGGDRDRAAMVAVGESDRMTLRFRKPAAGSTGTPAAAH